MTYKSREHSRSIPFMRSVIEAVIGVGSGVCIASSGSALVIVCFHFEMELVKWSMGITNSHGKVGTL